MVDLQALKTGLDSPAGKEMEFSLRLTMFLQQQLNETRALNRAHWEMLHAYWAYVQDAPDAAQLHSHLDARVVECQEVSMLLEDKVNSLEYDLKKVQEVAHLAN